MVTNGVERDGEYITLIRKGSIWGNIALTCRIVRAGSVGSSRWYARWYGMGLDGLAETAELLVSELLPNAVQAMVRQEDHTAVRLQLFGDSARVRIEVWDARPAAAASQTLRRGWHTRSQRRGRVWAVPGSGAERVLGLVSREGTHRQGRLVRA